MRRLILLTLLGLAAAPALAALTPEQAAENQPVTPFRIIGDVYYVGASDVASYRRFVGQLKAEFEAALAQQRGASSP